MANDQVPKPTTNSPAMQGIANQSFYGIAGVGTPPAQSPQEAIQKDPRNNPINPKLGGQ